MLNIILKRNSSIAQTKIFECSKIIRAKHTQIPVKADVVIIGTQSATNFL